MVLLLVITDHLKGVGFKELLRVILEDALSFIAKFTSSEDNPNRYYKGRKSASQVMDSGLFLTQKGGR